MTISCWKFIATFLVIPAQAGIQRGKGRIAHLGCPKWIPACAGMTVVQGVSKTKLPVGRSGSASLPRFQSFLNLPILKVPRHLPEVPFVAGAGDVGFAHRG